MSECRNCKELQILVERLRASQNPTAEHWKTRYDRQCAEHNQMLEAYVTQGLTLAKMQQALKAARAFAARATEQPDCTCESCLLIREHRRLIDEAVGK